MSNNVWPAPAKLNLFLHIIGRRKDGYHQLQTVFQILDYGDEIEFQPTDDSKIYVKGNYVEIAKDDDLVFRAASSLKQISGVNEGIDISINAEGIVDLRTRQAIHQEVQGVCLRRIYFRATGGRVMAAVQR